MSNVRFVLLFVSAALMAAGLVVQGLDWRLLSHYVMPAIAIGAVIQYLYDRIHVRSGGERAAEYGNSRRDATSD